MTDKQHALVSLDLVDGLFTWECACGVTDPGWWRSSNARKSWQSHCDMEALLRPAEPPSAIPPVPATPEPAPEPDSGTEGGWVGVDDRFDFDHCTCFDTLGPEGYPPPCDAACPQHGAVEARLVTRVVAWRRPRR